MNDDKKESIALNQFTDKYGVMWDLSLTAGDLTTVRLKVGVDLGAALRSEKALADALFSEPETFVRVLWIVCERQALSRDPAWIRKVEKDLQRAQDAEPLAPELAFGYSFNHESIEAASLALLGAIADFFPRSRISGLVKRRLPEILAKADEAAAKAVNQEIDRILTSKPNVTSSAV